MMEEKVMHDMRDYKGVIREAVRQERHKDQNWTWKVKAISKTKAQIGWGYLDYIGETTPFIVTIDDEDDVDEPLVIGVFPDGYRVYSWVGQRHWHDASTIEEGLAKVIRMIAMEAHSTY